MRILGISSHYHDSAAAIIQDGKIVAAVHEERFTRIKHDPGYPTNAITYCLQEAECTLSELDAVVYYEKPLLKFDRLLENYFYISPFGLKYFVQSLPIWIKQKLFMRQNLFKFLKRFDKNFKVESLYFSEHHLSHAASAFYPSPFEKALVLTLDGVGEWTTTSVALGDGSHLDIVKEIHFPHSLGLFYSAFTTFCGFKVNSGEYKLMGLAPYGEPRFKEQILERVITSQEDGSFSLNLEYFDFLKGDRMYSHKFSELFGISPRKPEGRLEQIHMDIAASAQAALEEVLLNMIQKLGEQYPHEHLCLAGGVALNCVANSKLLKQGPFKKIWVQPAAGDAGGALGAALAFYYMHEKKSRSVESDDQMQGALLGPSYTDQQIEKALWEQNLVYEKMSYENLIQFSADFLSRGKSLGWFQGRMEYGPRALGARSILADARSEEMQSKLNLQIKFRESFRPFAPMVLEEDVSEWFEWDEKSPYMLFVADVAKDLRINEGENAKLFGIERLKKTRSKVPAITHVDYSARLQTVGKTSGKEIQALLKEFKNITGCPVIVNTSFNVRGEPIVCAPSDAIKCFLGTNLDGLAIGNYFLKKSAQKRELLQSYHQEFTLD